MRKKKPFEATMGTAPAKEISVAVVFKVLRDAISLVQNFNDRFIIPDDFLPDHPDREKMIRYLKARSWRGTDSGAAMSAQVPPSKLREWRTIQEFADWEELANEACTDLLEETFIFQGLSTGDRQILEKALEARRERYSKKQEITGPKGGPITFEVRLGEIPRPTRLE